jgi:hypothetical protein
MTDETENICYVRNDHFQPNNDDLVASSLEARGYSKSKLLKFDSGTFGSCF